MSKLALHLFLVAYAFPYLAHAECAQDIIGKWQQTHVVFGGNKINDDSQSWEFSTDGTARFINSKIGIDASADYSCDGDIIYMKGRIPGRLKIVEFEGEMMAWESLDHGGGVTHVIRVQ